MTTKPLLANYSFKPYTDNHGIKHGIVATAPDKRKGYIRVQVQGINHIQELVVVSDETMSEEMFREHILPNLTEI